MAEVWVQFLQQKGKFDEQDLYIASVNCAGEFEQVCHSNRVDTPRMRLYLQGTEVESEFTGPYKLAHVNAFIEEELGAERCTIDDQESCTDDQRQQISNCSGSSVNDLILVNTNLEESLDEVIKAHHEFEKEMRRKWKMSERKILKARRRSRQLQHVLQQCIDRADAEEERELVRRMRLHEERKKSAQKEKVEL